MLKLRLAVGALALASGVVLAAPPKVDSQMQKVLDALIGLQPKPLHTLSPQEARRGPSAKDAVFALLETQGKEVKPEKVETVEDRTIAIAPKPVTVRVYSPKGDGPFPAIVYFHGGGFVIANLDTYDASARALSAQANAVVVSVHYRQAPEHPFPASHDDALAAFRWVRDHPQEFKVDPKRIAVAGESAGGNLATSVALREKTNGPVFQLLIYPFVSNDLTTPSHVKNGQGNFIVSNEALAWFWKHELGEGWEKNKSPEALPAYATVEMLKGSAPAMVIVAGLDPLLDEGIAYAKALEKAGVPTLLRQYDGVAHEFFGMSAVVEVSKRAQKDAVNALKKPFDVKKSAPAAAGRN